VSTVPVMIKHAMAQTSGADSDLLCIIGGWNRGESLQNPIGRYKPKKQRTRYTTCRAAFVGVWRYRVRQPVGDRLQSIGDERISHYDSDGNERSWSTIVLIVSFNSKISPFTPMVIFSDKSPMATAVVTAAMIFCASEPRKRRGMHPCFTCLLLGLLNSAL